MVLLFLVGLLSRRLERVNANVSRLLKATIMNGASAAPGGAVALVNGHVTMLKKTLSNESLRSSLSADDFASLQYMLGDEDGVNM
ncbi:hypothetical protein JL722_10569 [Aureococcus anophagefferens]|nr:hypothetical protein JL722_10569 [Aureococcus anophagefferens]